MSRTTSLTRRSFLRTTAAAALAVPTIAPASALGLGGRSPPSERITVAFIGTGKMANDYHLPELLRFPDVQALAVAEVDRNRREHARRRIEEAYSKDVGYNGCASTRDFRELLARKDLDAVCIATPDHWHAIPLIEACKAGKDVYCEKPLTLTIAEARLCVEAARKHARVVQTGSQQRSNVFGPFRQACEIVRSGRLGQLRSVSVGVGGPSKPCDLPEEAAEAGLDWDLWLGAAPLRPYNSTLSPRGVHNHFPNWRAYREYSGGAHSDMGAHHYDIAQWALDMDGSGPVEVIPPEDPTAMTGARFRYASGIELIHGGPDGCLFTGERGTLHITRGVLESTPESIAREPLGERETHLEVSPGHHRNWIDSIRSRRRPIADVEAGARTVTIVHLGNIAYWTRKRFRWDPAAWKIVGDPALETWLDRERRSPWTLPVV